MAKLQAVVSRVIVEANRTRLKLYGSPRNEQLLENSPSKIEAKVFGKPFVAPTAEAAKNSQRRRTPVR